MNGPMPVGPPGAQSAKRTGGARFLGLMGRLVGATVLIAAGVCGWIGIDRFDVEVPFTRSSSAEAAVVETVDDLPELGDGLPESRLRTPEPWRQFELTYQEGEKVERFAFDLDNWQLNVSSSGGPPGDEIEIDGDRGFVRRAGTDVWVEQSVQDTRNIASFLMAGIGPFVLTDLVPPNVLGFTTLELEGTSRGERVYEVSVDAPTLQNQHPLAYQRWVTMTRVVDASSEVYRIRVRPDGYIIRIDGLDRSVQWNPLPDGVEFFSPVATPAPAVTVPVVADPAAAPAPDVAPETAPVPAADPAVDPAVDPAPAQD